MRYDLLRGEDRVSLDIIARRPDLIVALDETPHKIEELSHGEDSFELRIDGCLHRGRRCITSRGIEIRLDGRTFLFQRLDGGHRAAVGGQGDEIRADMPGVLIACHVEPGALVEPGAPLVTIESMKLQMTISAPRAGRIARIHVAENVPFERGAALVSLVPPEPATASGGER